MTKRDRQGEPISVETWSNLRDDMSYRIVADDIVANVQIRTVWEGLDELPSAMFFTGISSAADQFDTVASADTEQQAQQHHDHVISLLREDSSLATAQRLRQSLAEATG